MNRDRIIQLGAIAVMGLATAASGALLPGLIRQSDRHALRYTDVSVEGAPPFVALGTAIGALRGLIVDYLWIKVHVMKEKGLFYEVMADAELITKLQPRFAAVWAFHGHNMAYNISVATHTEQERWEWVNAGIRLVRNEGLRYNPNDLQLHRELAFWFAHKIEGVADDAHLYYKREFCREWHYLLGEPPVTREERTEWMRAIAEAPGTIGELQAAVPSVETLLADLAGIYESFDRPFAANADLLRAFQEWQIIRQRSAAAEAIGLADDWREKRPFFRAFDDLAREAGREEAWDALVQHLRKRVLEDDYNMDPQKMYEYTRDLGPIDWRNPQAHALYWSRLGSEKAERRMADPDDIYTVVNNDRIQLQAMQGLARFGRMYYDPVTNEDPGRYPEPRWIDVIDGQFDYFYAKHYETRGGGGESFIGFLQNFLSSAVREWYRAGEKDKAQALLDRLNSLFGTGQAEFMGQDFRFIQDLDVFVRNETIDEYEFQPHLAVSDVASSLRYGFLAGVGRDQPELLDQAVEFAREITAYFQGNEYNNYVNKFGRGRMAEILSRLEDSILLVFRDIMIDRSLNLVDRMYIWQRANEADERLQGWMYDMIAPFIQRELETSPLGQRYTLDEVLP
ncbi:MAG: hypothetical protein ACYTGC_01865, partial [Planctomycetota bacterium]